MRVNVYVLHKYPTPALPVTDLNKGPLKNVRTTTKYTNIIN